MTATVERCAFCDEPAIGTGRYGKHRCRDHLRDHIERYGVGSGR